MYYMHLLHNYIPEGLHGNYTCIQHIIYILYHEQVYNLLLFSLILISVYGAGAGNILLLALFAPGQAGAWFLWPHSIVSTYFHI